MHYTVICITWGGLKESLWLRVNFTVAIFFSSYVFLWLVIWLSWIPKGSWIKNKGWFVSELAVDGLRQCAGCNQIHNTSSFIWRAALDSHYTLSDSLFTIQPVKLYTSMILSQPQFTNNVCHAVKNITINQSPTYGGMVTFPKTMFWRPSLNRLVCVWVCVCDAYTHMTIKCYHNKVLLFSKLTFHSMSWKSSFWNTVQCLWY